MEVHTTLENLSASAVRQAAHLIRQAVSNRGKARIIAATGNSQIALIKALVMENIDWSATEVFHMDEYLGIGADHPASFRRWIHERIEAIVHRKRLGNASGQGSFSVVN